MNRNDFVEKTIYIYDDDIFNDFKKKIIKKYLSFYILKDSEITKKIFSEKIIDYIEKVEIKTDNLLNKHLKTYINDIGTLVRNYLVDGSRAKQYYEYVCKKVDTEDIGIKEMADYTRVILCQYKKIINEDHHDIENFDLSFDTVDLDAILLAMEKEKVPEVDLGVFNLGMKNKFNTKDIYGSDAFSFFLIIVFYYYLKNIQVRGAF